MNKPSLLSMPALPATIGLLLATPAVASAHPVRTGPDFEPARLPVRADDGFRRRPQPGNALRRLRLGRHALLKPGTVRTKDCVSGRPRGPDVVSTVGARQGFVLTDVGHAGDVALWRFRNE